MSALTHLVEFSAAFDKRHADPKKNYGIHGVEMRCVVKGDKGAVQFLLFTQWQLPHVTKETDARTVGSCDALQLQCFYHPYPVDLGYHSPIPHYDGQEPLADCPYLDGQPCYYDGSGLNAEPVFERLLREGDKGLWSALEEYYRLTFKEELDHVRP